jgi:hypothetical protein
VYLLLQCNLPLLLLLLVMVLRCLLMQLLFGICLVWLWVLHPLAFEGLAWPVILLVVCCLLGGILLLLLLVVLLLGPVLLLLGPGCASLLNVGLEVGAQLGLYGPSLGP